MTHPLQKGIRSLFKNAPIVLEPENVVVLGESQDTTTVVTANLLTFGCAVDSCVHFTFKHTGVFNVSFPVYAQVCRVVYDALDFDIAPGEELEIPDAPAGMRRTPYVRPYIRLPLPGREKYVLHPTLRRLLRPIELARLYVEEVTEEVLEDIRVFGHESYIPPLMSRWVAELCYFSLIGQWKEWDSNRRHYLKEGVHYWNLRTFHSPHMSTRYPWDVDMQSQW